jgi:hypothetical protein
MNSSYFGHRINQVVVGDEGRDVWSVYLSKAQDVAVSHLSSQQGRRQGQGQGQTAAPSLRTQQQQQKNRDPYAAAKKASNLEEVVDTFSLALRYCKTEVIRQIRDYRQHCPPPNLRIVRRIFTVSLISPFPLPLPCSFRTGSANGLKC